MNYVGVHIPVYLERHLWAVSLAKTEKLSIFQVENEREMCWKSSSKPIRAAFSE